MNLEIARRIIGWFSAWGLLTLILGYVVYNPSKETTEEAKTSLFLGCILAALVLGLVISVWCRF